MSLIDYFYETNARTKYLQWLSNRIIYWALNNTRTFGRQKKTKQKWLFCHKKFIVKMSPLLCELCPGKMPPSSASRCVYAPGETIIDPIEF